jgi:putative phosphoesterase
MSAITLGVIADTHIPDRAAQVPLAALDLFARNKVHAILHAGDLSVPRVLHQLAEVAPVHAIRGNTDVLLLGKLPWKRRLEFEGVSIGMVHGHGNWLKYIPNRIDYFLQGPKKFSYYEETARHQLPGCQVVVCGHTHVPANYWREGQLIFNPGSATKPNAVMASLPRSVGLLHLDQGNVRGEIVFI